VCVVHFSSYRPKSLSVLVVNRMATERKTPREQQSEPLNLYYKKVAHPQSTDDAEGDDLANFGEFWELQEQNLVQFWSLNMIPMTRDCCLITKNTNSPTYLPLSLHEKVKDISNGDGSKIMLHCVTTRTEWEKKNQYNFTLILDSAVIPFNISPLIASLEHTEFRGMMKELENKFDSQYFMSTSGQPLRGAQLCSKIRKVIQNFETFKAKMDMQSLSMTPISVSLNNRSQGGSAGSTFTDSPRPQQTRGKRKPNTPLTPTPPPKSHLGSSSKKRKTVDRRAPEDVDDVSLASAVTDLPEPVQGNKKPDFARSTEAYKTFWSSCTDAFVWGIEHKKSIPIEQLVDAPPDMNIKSYEPGLAEKIMGFLLSMPDRSTKQTLCVMPCDLDEKPTSWDSIKDGKFWLINGQHSVKASFMMREQRMDPKDIKEFAQWNCFIVWTKNNEKLRQISAYYNRVNHFGAIKPSWATNILGARQVWIKLNRPKNPKELVQVGTSSQASRTKEATINKTKFNVMFSSTRPE